MLFKTVSIQTPDGEEIATVRAVHGPNVIRVKRLGWRRLEEADREKQKASIGLLRDLGGPAVMKEFREAADSASEDGKSLRDKLAEDTKKDPLTRYDQRHLLLIGIVEIDGADHRAASDDAAKAARDAAIDDFETETAEATARAILKLARPALFETEAAAKNG